MNARLVYVTTSSEDGAKHRLADGMILADSYHCSRYNLNTGRLTEAMFHAVFQAIRRILEAG